MEEVYIIEIRQRYGSVIATSEHFNEIPTKEDFEKFFDSTLKNWTIDGSGQFDKLYPNMSGLIDGYVEVKRCYYWNLIEGR